MAYQVVLTNYAQSRKAHAAQYRIGMTQHERGATLGAQYFDEELTALQTFVTNFPASAYVPDAQIHIDDLQGLRANH